MSTPNRWEFVRHQVAICGRVMDVEAQPVADVPIVITAMPKEFGSLVNGAVVAYGDKSNKRPDRTVSRRDGIFYFLDLPAGHYTLRVIAPGSSTKHEKSVSVDWDQDGRVNKAVVDFKLQSTKGVLQGNRMKTPKIS